MPLLINYGVKDTAMPVEQGARLLIKAANQAGNTNVTLRYYDANHQLRTGSFRDCRWNRITRTIWRIGSTR